VLTESRKPAKSGGQMVDALAALLETSR
jgi:hypothetical protein